MSKSDLWVALALAAAATGAAAQPTGPVPWTTRDLPQAKGFEVEDVLTGLDHPWAIAWLPDGERLITERKGTLLSFAPGSTEPREVEVKFPDFHANGQGGLMDISLHPDFAENRWVYFTFEQGATQRNHTVVGRGRYENGAIEDIDVIFEVDQWKAGGQHFGSRILWLPDGTFLVSIGDGGNPPVRYEGDWIRKQAQNKGADLGKVHRLNADGSAPNDNPFADEYGSENSIYTYGHRNIQGLARDPESGRIWANEHGARGGDELNLLEAGDNYGWPTASYSREYTADKAVADKTTLSGAVDPKIVWTPSKAPSGMCFYTGDAFPEWKGDLLSGSLVFREVQRIVLDGDSVDRVELIPVGQRVRDVRQGPDGLVYVLTDEDNGKLMRIKPAKK